MTEKGPTPRQELEAEVLQMRKPLRIILENPEGERREVTIKPLGWEDMEALAAVVAQVGRHAMMLIGRMQDIGSAMVEFAVGARSAVGGEDAEAAPDLPVTAEEMLGQAAAKVFDEQALRGALGQARDLVRILVETATDAPWDEIGKDYIASAELALKAIQHNMGPRLRAFFSEDAIETFRVFGLPAGSEEKPSSSAKDTPPVTSITGQ